MRLKKTVTKNSISYYAIKSVTIDGKNTSRIVHKFGTHQQLREELGGQEPEVWVKQQIEKMNQAEDEENKDVLIRYAPNKVIPLDEQHAFQCGYLFLQSIFYQLGLPQICKRISQDYKFEYDLQEILSSLIYGRMLFPASKKSTVEQAKVFLESPRFQLQDVYRALDVIAESSDFIQAQLYKNSVKLHKRQTGVLYYDCTNFFFEIDQAEGLKQYGLSKEHRPNPIVQLGLFMDADGIPLAFHLFEGNQNEQTTLKPLEKKIMKDFECAKFVVCTDAGLSSTENRLFNSMQERAFVTTQSVKKLKVFLKAWALSPEGWSCQGSKATFNLSDLDEEKDKEKIFYKERWIKENGLEQRLIVSFSLKYRQAQRAIRENQIESALKNMKQGPTKVEKKNPKDYRRFIASIATTPGGEIADKKQLYLNEKQIAQEALYDGFYAICTNLEDEVPEILAINKRRWQIEDCFRILKQEFRSRPIYLQKDNRILSHFMTCFIALIIFRLFEQKVNLPGEHFTASALIHTLRHMEFSHKPGEGYIPHYTRTKITDAVHGAFGFRTDYQIYTQKKCDKLIKESKK